MGSTLATLRKLREVGRRADPEFDRLLAKLALFSLAGAVAELATLGSLVPLLALLADGRQPESTIVASLMPATKLGMVLLFAGLVLVTALIRLALTAAIQRGVLHVGHAINSSIQRRLLDQPYLFHVASNSSRFVAALQKSDQLTLGMLRPLLQGFAGLLIGSAILAFLVATIGWAITLGAATVLGGAYLAMSRLAGWRLVERGRSALDAYEDQVRLMMESSGAIRDILLDNRQPIFAARFERASARMAEARAGTDLLSQAPRYLIEAMGAIALATLAALIAVREGGIGGSLTLFGLLALAMVRIVPLAQMAYSGWTRLAANRQAVDDVEALLALPLAADSEADSAVSGQPLPFARSLTVEDVHFAYPGVPEPVLDGVSFAIAAGEWIGLTGPTGAGKSTLGDLMMGLLVPDSGQVLIDGDALTGARHGRWQQAIGHVSQSVYLLDDTIAANIALASDAADADTARIAESARIAQLAGWIASLRDGYGTIVGERGQRLSGGQRQRIALARALYKDSAIMVLDEATNALDEASESALLDSLRHERPSLTVVLISHRASTLERCDRILVVEGGRVTPA